MSETTNEKLVLEWPKGANHAHVCFDDKKHYQVQGATVDRPPAPAPPGWEGPEGSDWHDWIGKVVMLSGYADDWRPGVLRSVDHTGVCRFESSAGRSARCRPLTRAESGDVTP